MSRLILIALAAVTLAAPTLAAELEHEVQSGEYASLIAKNYYGDVERADLLLRYNGKSDTVVHPGETMRIPYSAVHRVASGETWSGLAQRYAGRASAYRTIAALNGLDPGKGLRVGQAIVMPVVLEHDLARGESLAKLADRFYGDTKMAGLLEKFNDIDDPRRLSVGTKVRIPLVSLRLVDEVDAPPVASAPPKPTPPPEPPEFEAEIREARNAFDTAEFDAVGEMLERIRERVQERGSREEQAELWRLLAFTNVALDRTDRACAAYDSLTALGLTETEFDPDLVSPKILRAFDECAENAR